ncbi:lipopolysaccharide biosynthesis protein [Haematobacter massiliensis]|uniref:lipopolysaccharide biosynthesis protein n=1 Tax=Haematobacter massiliensis TaxID=195105 RepID=UPI0023F47522|nr:lipopolysaccharide biosynthesis protein [Haematobacter massiliensis]
MRQKLKSALFGGPAGAVFRGMSILAIGGMAARVIGFASYPIVTRLYSSHDFGIAALMLAFTGMIAPLLTLRYGTPIAQQRSDGAAMNLFVLSLTCALTIIAVVTLVLFFWGERLFARMSMEDLAPWWWLVPVGLIASVTYEMLLSWGVRRRNYRVISQSQISQSITSSLAKIGFGLAAAGPIGLLLGGVLASAGGSGRMLRAFLPDFRKSFRMVSWRRMRYFAWRFRSFPIYRLPSHFLLAFAMQAPLIFSASLYDPATTGQFGLAMQVMALPIVIISQTLGNAYYGEIAKLGRRQAGRIFDLSKIIQKRLFLVGILPTLVVTFWGPSLFSLVFGANWAQAGYFASWLALYMLFQVTSTPLMQVFNIMGNLAAYLIINGLRVALLLVLYWACRRTGAEAEVYVASYSMIMVFFYLFSSGYVFFELARAARRQREGSSA